MIEPCERPVSNTLKPAVLASLITSDGNASVAISISFTIRHLILSRTQPPSKNTFAPSAPSTFQTARTELDLSQSKFQLSRKSFRIFIHQSNQKMILLFEPLHPKCSKDHKG